MTKRLDFFEVVAPVASVARNEVLYHNRNVALHM